MAKPHRKNVFSPSTRNISHTLYNNYKGSTEEYRVINLIWWNICTNQLHNTMCGYHNLRRTWSSLEKNPLLAFRMQRIVYGCCWDLYSGLSIDISSENWTVSKKPIDTDDFYTCSSFTTISRLAVTKFMPWQYPNSGIQTERAWRMFLRDWMHIFSLSQVA